MVGKKLEEYGAEIFIAVFYKSDFIRLSNYSQSIGKWTKYYFLNNFCIDNTTDSALAIYEKDSSLIRLPNIKISNIDNILSDLYIFTTSPYKLLNIAHVYRRDELPSLQTSAYNYQRPGVH